MLSVLTNTHMLMAARETGVERFFYSSSACVYNGEKQTSPDVVAFKESDAYPALPEDGYGWEKLFSERMCRHFEEDYGLQCRVARLPQRLRPQLGTWTGGREKAPAAVCRKVIEAKHSGKHEIEIWGDGKQTRSFMYIDDCTKGTQMIYRERHSRAPEPRLRRARHHQPARRHRRRHRRHQAEAQLQSLSAPKGVNGRNSDNTLILEKLGWEPSIKLRDGMERTYNWIESEMLATVSR